MKESAGHDMAQSMWVLWWTEWQWDRFYSEDFNFFILNISAMLHTHSFVNQ
jgi:hypothetical protein